ncbi:MAG: DUF3047 domain-containing protein [Hylemonella sp.]|uniref:DUF3047 domain-containing protein n=1 Tax=Hylemonella sp. TaxID=2066020 RepID=UPI0022BD3A48|nr:DUF3047 domain-containing protein [Hylemonella sp.]MCZ8253608.1 DUF3047 domain-containing protein [Hylemonella sp.]
MWWRISVLAVWAALLAGCGHGPKVAKPAEADGAFAAWQHWPLPGKSPTAYRPVLYGGTRDAVEVQARSSASLLRRSLNLPPQDVDDIRFSWKVPALIPGADMARRETEDAVVRIVLTFDGDRTRLSARDRTLSELAQLMTGEPLPYATLMYVWCPTRELGSVITNPRTDRIRKLVVESGPARLNQWLDYERDIRADFRQVFGEEPGRLLHVAIMSDGDNTGSEFRAWYGPVLIEGVDVASQD